MNLGINYEWICGLVFGIEADQIYLVQEEGEEPDWDEPPSQVIYLHLGIIAISFIF